MQNEAVVLVARPAGVPQAEHFALRSMPLPELAEGQLLVRNEYLSVEPAMRGWVSDVGNYSVPVAIGAVMRSMAVGRVIASKDPGYAEGDVVTGWFGWQTLAIVSVAEVVRRVLETDLPISLTLGVLGINGVTAHLALTGIGSPVAGETVVVSTAAGAVGSAVGQIAKIIGCRTVGVAGGPEKVALCREAFSYDAAIDYHSEGLAGQIAAACPDGVNVYFDNTAGAISDAVFPYLAVRARTASVSNWSDWPVGPRVERHLLVKRARMEGFVIFDHMDRYEASVAQLANWVRDGSLRYREDMQDGLKACPDAIAGLYRGENLGKRLIRL